MNKKAVESLKKRMEETSTSKSKRSKSSNEQLKYAGKSIQSSEPANSGEPEQAKDVVDKEVHRNNILKGWEEESRQLADMKESSEKLDQDLQTEIRG